MENGLQLGHLLFAYVTISHRLVRSTRTTKCLPTLVLLGFSLLNTFCFAVM